MLESYSDNNSTSGLLKTGPEDMRKKIEQALQYGWQVVRMGIGMLYLNSSKTTPPERTRDRGQGQPHRAGYIRRYTIRGAWPRN